MENNIFELLSASKITKGYSIVQWIMGAPGGNTKHIRIGCITDFDHGKIEALISSVVYEKKNGGSVHITFIEQRLKPKDYSSCIDFISGIKLVEILVYFGAEIFVRKLNASIKPVKISANLVSDLGIELCSSDSSRNKIIFPIHVVSPDSLNLIAEHYYSSLGSLFKTRKSANILATALCDTVLKELCSNILVHGGEVGYIYSYLVRTDKQSTQIDRIIIACGDFGSGISGTLGITENNSLNSEAEKSQSILMSSLGDYVSRFSENERKVKNLTSFTGLGSIRRIIEETDGEIVICEPVQKLVYPEKKPASPSFETYTTLGLCVKIEIPLIDPASFTFTRQQKSFAIERESVHSTSKMHFYHLQGSVGVSPIVAKHLISFSDAASLINSHNSWTIWVLSLKYIRDTKDYLWPRIRKIISVARLQYATLIFSDVSDGMALRLSNYAVMDRELSKELGDWIVLCLSDILQPYAIGCVKNDEQFMKPSGEMLDFIYKHSISGYIKHADCLTRSRYIEKEGDGANVELDRYISKIVMADVLRSKINKNSHVISDAISSDPDVVLQDVLLKSGIVVDKYVNIKYLLNNNSVSSLFLDCLKVTLGSLNFDGIASTAAVPRYYIEELMQRFVGTAIDGSLRNIFDLQIYINSQASRSDLEPSFLKAKNVILLLDGVYKGHELETILDDLRKRSILVSAVVAMFKFTMNPGASSSRDEKSIYFVPHVINLSKAKDYKYYVDRISGNIRINERALAKSVSKVFEKPIDAILDLVAAERLYNPAHYRKRNIHYYGRFDWAHFSKSKSTLRNDMTSFPYSVLKKHNPSEIYFLYPADSFSSTFVHDTISVIERNMDGVRCYYSFFDRTYSPQGTEYFNVDYTTKQKIKKIKCVVLLESQSFTGVSLGLALKCLAESELSIDTSIFLLSFVNSMDEESNKNLQGIIKDFKKLHGTNISYHAYTSFFSGMTIYVDACKYCDYTSFFGRFAKSSSTWVYKLYVKANDLLIDYDSIQLSDNVPYELIAASMFLVSNEKAYTINALILIVRHQVGCRQYNVIELLERSDVISDVTLKLVILHSLTPFVNMLHKAGYKTSIYNIMNNIANQLASPVQFKLFLNFVSMFDEYDGFLLPDSVGTIVARMKSFDLSFCYAELLYILNGKDLLSFKNMFFEHLYKYYVSAVQVSDFHGYDSKIEFVGHLLSLRLTHSDYGKLSNSLNQLIRIAGYFADVHNEEHWYLRKLLSMKSMKSFFTEQDLLDINICVQMIDDYVNYFEIVASFIPDVWIWSSQGHSQLRQASSDIKKSLKSYSSGSVVLQDQIKVVVALLYGDNSAAQSKSGFSYYSKKFLSGFRYEINALIQDVIGFFERHSLCVVTKDFDPVKFHVLVDVEKWMQAVVLLKDNILKWGLKASLNAGIVDMVRQFQIRISLACVEDTVTLTYLNFPVAKPNATSYSGGRGEAEVQSLLSGFGSYARIATSESSEFSFSISLRRAFQ